MKLVDHSLVISASTRPVTRLLRFLSSVLYRWGSVTAGHWS